MLSTQMQLLNGKGISLTELGLREIALPRPEALHAVTLLQRDAIPILGGDVFFRQGSKIEWASANWYGNPKPGEGRDEFDGRSTETASKYIEAFPSRADVEPLFAIVSADSWPITHGLARQWVGSKYTTAYDRNGNLPVVVTAKRRHRD
jgi:hypothetical protein